MRKQDRPARLLHWAGWLLLLGSIALGFGATLHASYRYEICDGRTCVRDIREVNCGVPWGSNLLSNADGQACAPSQQSWRIGLGVALAAGVGALFVRRVVVD